MSRLYAWIENDKGQERTLRGDTSISTQINYGSKEDSKLAVRVRIEYPKGNDKPKIYLTIAEEIEALNLKPNV